MRSAVEPVRGGVRLQPAHRGAHVLDVGGKRDRRGQAILDRRHREPVLREVAPEVRPGRPRAAGPSPAVQEHNHRDRPADRDWPADTGRAADRRRRARRRSACAARGASSPDRRPQLAAATTASESARQPGSARSNEILRARLERQRAAQFRRDLPADRHAADRLRMREQRRAIGERRRRRPSSRSDPAAAAAASPDARRADSRRGLARSSAASGTSRPRRRRTRRGRDPRHRRGRQAAAPPRPSPSPRPRPPPILTKKLSKMPGVRNAANRL